MKRIRNILIIIWFGIVEPLYDDFASYQRLMVKLGIVRSNGRPKICVECGRTSEHFHIYNEYYENGVGTVEYDLRCKCGNAVGHWAYGNWHV